MRVGQNRLPSISINFSEMNIYLAAIFSFTSRVPWPIAHSPYIIYTLQSTNIARGNGPLKMVIFQLGKKTGWIRIKHRQHRQNSWTCSRKYMNMQIIHIHYIYTFRSSYPSVEERRQLKWQFVVLWVKPGGILEGLRGEETSGGPLRIWDPWESIGMGQRKLPNFLQTPLQTLNSPISAFLSVKYLFSQERPEVYVSQWMECEESAGAGRQRIYDLDLSRPCVIFWAICARICWYLQGAEWGNCCLVSTKQYLLLNALILLQYYFVLLKHHSRLILPSTRFNMI